MTSKYFHYCDCSQGDPKNRFEKYGRGKMKLTKVDEDGFCVYCEHVAVAFRTQPSSNMDIYGKLTGGNKKINRKNSKYERTDDFKGVNSRHYRDKAFKRGQNEGRNVEEKIAYFYDEHTLHL